MLSLTKERGKTFFNLRNGGAEIRDAKIADCRATMEKSFNEVTGGARRQLVVRQVKEWGEILAGLETRNRYEILDQDNNLVGYAITTGEVLVKSDGTPWRPLAQRSSSPWPEMFRVAHEARLFSLWRM